MQTQVGGYALRRGAGRTPQELNRLRTLALAVVSITNFDLVTPTAEDREYFRLFNTEAHLDQRQTFIREACEILYNVQEVDAQGEQARRDRVLGYILAGLTSLTLISVTADAYNFVSATEPIIRSSIQRAETLLEFLLALGVLALLTVFLFLTRSGRGRRRP